jgi:hypothetical protein
MTLTLLAAASAVALTTAYLVEKRRSPLKARAAKSTLHAALRRERSIGR